MRTSASPPFSAVIWRLDRGRQVNGGGRVLPAPLAMPGLHVYPGPEMLGAERRHGPVHAPLTSGAGLPYVRRDREVMALILKVPHSRPPGRGGRPGWWR